MLKQKCKQMFIMIKYENVNTKIITINPITKHAQHYFSLFIHIMYAIV